jgi:HD-GYP domain-containing protein (c-di-GMP phosphodiesterase class II)
MAVADVFDAMTSIRDYRDPANPYEVLETLKREVGTHFDGRTVAAFERYFIREGLGEAILERNRKDMRESASTLKSSPDPQTQEAIRAPAS